MTNNADSQEQPALWDGPDAKGGPGRRAGHKPVRSEPVMTMQRSVTAGLSELWSIDQVASYLGVPKQTIYCWRTSGYGPQGFRVGKHVRWRAETVVAWTLDLEGRG